MRIPEQDRALKVAVYHDTSEAAPDVGVTYLHCQRCLDEWKESFSDTCSPKEYARQQCAMTEDGLQVWCTRHDVNITTMALRAVREEGGE